MFFYRVSLALAIPTVLGSKVSVSPIELLLPVAPLTRAIKGFSFAAFGTLTPSLDPSPIF